jgi:anti-sigma B factor antagonist
MNTSLEVGVEHDDGTTVVSPLGEIDMATAPKLRASLLTTNGHVVVDLSAVSVLDSTGIAVLAEARKRLSGAGGDLVLRKPEGIVRQALETMGFGDWIED